MRIGVITFHCAHNYGAVLQNYALQQYLIGEGYTVETIDYCPEWASFYHPYPNVKWDGNILLYLARHLKRIIYLPIRYMRYRKFQRFIDNHLRLSQGIDVAKYDVVIVGSDQIWNPNITGYLDDMYFAYGNACKEVRKVAYAASASLAKLTEGEAVYFRQRLADFAAISVREMNLQALLQPLVEEPIAVTIDPTFLIDRHHYDKIAVAPKSKRPYVFVYQAAYDPVLITVARQIAKKLNANVIEASALIRFFNKSYIKQYVSPEQWIGYIKEAACVVTSSFHGTAFSIIYERPFYVVDIPHLRGGSNNRLLTMLKTADLMDRYITTDNVPAFTGLDRTHLANSPLQQQIQRSKEFLKTNIDTRP